MEELEFVYDPDTDTWKEHKEPYMTVEFATEEDWNFFQKIMDFWEENHKGE